MGSLMYLSKENLADGGLKRIIDLRCLHGGKNIALLRAAHNELIQTFLLGEGALGAVDDLINVLPDVVLCQLSIFAQRPLSFFIVYANTSLPSESLPNNSFLMLIFVSP